MITCTAVFVTMVATLEIITMSTSGGSITVHRRELCSALLGTPVVSGGKEQETETKVRRLLCFKVINIENIARITVLTDCSHALRSEGAGCRR